MRLEPYGDSAFLIRGLGQHEASQVAQGLRAQATVVEAVAAYGEVLVVGQPDLSNLNLGQGSLPTLWTIPVCYQMGPDLEEVAEALGRSVHDVVSAHTSIAYDCLAIGFCPGFPYLGPLPEAIAGLPRRATPRVRVEPGSVAITGDQTAIYPAATPGGWHLIGLTPLEIVNEAEDYFPIRVGDQVRFESISAEEFSARKGQRL